MKMPIAGKTPGYSWFITDEDKLFSVHVLDVGIETSSMGLQILPFHSAGKEGEARGPM